MVLGVLIAWAALSRVFAALDAWDQAVIMAACWIPTLADVFAQNASRHAYRSSRWMRVATGIPLGVGIVPAGSLVKAAIWW
jgi:hypothetical protein